MNRRVVVTGMAGISPIGNGWKEVRESLQAGRSGVVRMDAWDGVAGLRTRVARAGAELRGAGRLAAPQDAQHGARLAARHARDRARARGRGPPRPSGARRRPHRRGYGCTQGSPRALEVYARQFYGKQTTSGIRGSDFIRFMSHTIAANIAQFFGPARADHPDDQRVHVGQSGDRLCREAIRYGRQDVMVAGGAEEMDGIDAVIFDILLAASTRNDEPQQHAAPVRRRARRRGGGRGRGNARARGARVRARARRADHRRGSSATAPTATGLHMTNPSPDGMEQVMRLALADAQLDADAVDYVNAHGTGTEVGDIAESEATLRVFGRRVPVSTLKGHTGHTLGACGALEAWISLEMLREGWVAPTQEPRAPRLALRRARLRDRRAARARRGDHRLQQLRVRRREHLARVRKWTERLNPLSSDSPGRRLAAEPFALRDREVGTSRVPHYAARARSRGVVPGPVARALAISALVISSSCAIVIPPPARRVETMYLPAVGWHGSHVPLHAGLLAVAPAPGRAGGPREMRPVTTASARGKREPRGARCPRRISSLLSAGRGPSGRTRYGTSHHVRRAEAYSRDRRPRHVGLLVQSKR
jgi:3-oxoacyl-[acyl-carrier-protein] synthase II